MGTAERGESMTDENIIVEKFRRETQPKCADEIKDAISIGFHLKCLRCGAVYYHTRFAMSEMGYRMYSYCPDCINKGIEALKEKDKQDKRGRNVPLDKLCEWLNKYDMPCEMCEDYLGCSEEHCDRWDSAFQIGLNKWEMVLNKWMEGLDAEAETST